MNMRVILRVDVSRKLFFLGLPACTAIVPAMAQSNPCAPIDPHEAASWSRVPQAAHPDTLSAQARKARDDYFSRFYDHRTIKWRDSIAWQSPVYWVPMASWA